MFRPTFESLENRDLFSVVPLRNMPTPIEQPVQAAIAAANERFDSRTLPHVDGLILEFAGYLDDTDIVQLLRSPAQAPATQALFAGCYGDGRFAGFVNTTFDDEAALLAPIESVGKDEKISIGGNRTESARLTDTDGDGLITFLSVATGDVTGDGCADVVRGLH